MIKDISYYKSIQNAFGTTSKKEYNISKLKKNISSHFKESIDYEAATKVDGVTQQLIVVKTKDEYVKTVIAYPTDTISVGQIIDCYGEKYLMTKVDSNKQTFTQGKMTQSNYTLKFQAPDGTILSYPCIDSNSSGDEEENKTITVGDSTKKITIQYNENTISLQNGRRFFIDRNTVSPKSYEIVGIDSTSKNYGDKGLIVLTVRECVGENTSEFPDRIDLGICNYFEPIVPPEPIEGYSYSTIVCSNPSNELTLGGTTRTLTPIFYESDGTISTEIITAVWTWTFNGINESNFVITYVGNQAKIKVVENYDLIGMIITANIMSSNGGYGGELILTIMA